MCGLVGVITKRKNGFTKEQQDIFANLLFIDVLRGKDSTGAFCVNNEGDVYVAKDVGHSLNFMNTKEYEELQRKAWNRGSALIGHNRAATRGVISDKNAHPFNVNDNIILVHNGTMRSDHKRFADVDVDSHAIAHLIEEKGSVAEALGAFNGAYALIWYDIEKAELNMIRNDERPLFWLETDDAFVWCSERSMLEFATNRVGAKIKQEVSSLPVDLLQKFKLVGKEWEVSSEKVEIKKPEYDQRNFMGGATSGGAHNEHYYELSDWPYQGESERPPFRQSTEDWTEYRRERELANRRADALFRRPNTSPKHGPVQLLPRLPGHIEVREPPEFHGCDRREREMAQNLNKTITQKHYRDHVIGRYPYNTQLHVQPFDYCYVNGSDTNDGFYLYAHPLDDDDVIVRQFFSSKSVTEERMMQLAGCEYIFEFTLGTRGWMPMDPTQAFQKIEDDCPGYVVVRSNGAKMIASPDQRPQGENVTH